MIPHLADAALALAAIAAGAAAVFARSAPVIVAAVVVVAGLQTAIWASLGVWPLAALELLSNGALVGWLLLRLRHEPAGAFPTPLPLRAASALAGATVVVGLLLAMPAAAPRDAAAVALTGSGLAAALTGSSWLRRLAGFNLVGAGVMLVLSGGQIGPMAQGLVACIMLVAAGITLLSVQLLRQHDGTAGTPGRA